MVGADSVRLLGSFMRHGSSGGRSGGDRGAASGSVVASAAESGALGDLAGTAATAALRALWGADRIWHFLGPRATFTHAATSSLISRYASAGEGEAQSLNACATIAAVFDAVVGAGVGAGANDGVPSSCCGVVPIENSTAGAVLETIDLLHEHAGSLRIVAQVRAVRSTVITFHANPSHSDLTRTSPLRIRAASSPDRALPLQPRPECCRCGPSDL